MRSWRSWGYERLDSLPGFRVAPSPNAWGRTAGAPGAWRGESPTGRWRRGVQRSRWSRRWSSRRRSETSSRSGERSPRSSIACSHGRSVRGARRGRSRSGRGSSGRRTVTLREPTADPARLRVALAPKLAELPAPALKLRLELAELAEHTGEQLELVAAEGTALHGKLKEGLRQVRASVGAGGVSTVVEVAPWSRVPEARALLVPRDD